MSKRPNLPINPELQREVRRVNKLVQNKQSRIRVNEGLEVLDFQTSKLKEFNSEKEVDRYLKRMDRFLKGKSDFRVENVHGVEVDSYNTLKNIVKGNEKSNKQKAKLWDEVKDQEFKYSGKGVGYTVKDQASPKIGFGDVRFADLEPEHFDINSFMNQAQWERRKQALKKKYVGKESYLERLNREYKKNYIKSLKNALPNSKALQRHIRNMDMDKFMQMTFTEGNAHIDFVYDPLSQESRIQELNRIWGVGSAPKKKKTGKKKKKGRRKK